MFELSRRDKTKDREICESVIAIPESLTPIPEVDYIPESEVVYRFASELQRLSMRVSASFKLEAVNAGHNELPWLVIDHGFAVCATGITKCKLAYDRYISQNDAIGDTKTLVEALRNPRTIRFFTHIANMTNAENREFETFFNLRGNFGKGDYDEFTFKSGDGYFEPSPELLTYAKINAMYARAGLAAQEGVVVSELGVCPAVHLIPKVWNSLVSTCVREGLLTIE